MKMLLSAMVLATVCTSGANAAPLAQPREQSDMSTVARQALQDFGACVADESPEKAARTLHEDFRSSAYQASMKVLAGVNHQCLENYRHVKTNARLKSSGMLFAGAIAERLMEKDGQPLSARFAKAASGSESQTFSPSDKVAACVVRSAPDQTAALFATKVGTADESKAIDALAPALQACSRMIAPMKTNVAGERAMLATAAFRTIDPAA